MSSEQAQAQPVETVDGYPSWNRWMAATND
jgi:hypothetical protein